MTKITTLKGVAALTGGVALSALMAGAAFADPALVYDGGGKFDAPKAPEGAAAPADAASAP